MTSSTEIKEEEGDLDNDKNDATTMASSSPSLPFDPFRREEELQREAAAWEVRSDLITEATNEEIPVLDLGPWLRAVEKAETFKKRKRNNTQENQNKSSDSDINASNEDDANVLRDALALQVREACHRVGFFIIRNHSVPAFLRTNLLRAMHSFFARSDKMKYAMPNTNAMNVTANINTDDATQQSQSPSPPPGTGYLPVGHYKLPRRAQPNMNECFIVKQTQDIRLVEDNPWPTTKDDNHNDSDVKSKSTVDETSEDRSLQAAATAYAQAMVALGQDVLLPLFARGLELPVDFFDEAFAEPTFRLRLTHYPPTPADSAGAAIHPHVDTSFCTVLAQDSPGLVVQLPDTDPDHDNSGTASPCSYRWVRVPDTPNNELIVNVGEFLGRYWTHDYFVAAKHFVQMPDPVASQHKNSGEATGVDCGVSPTPVTRPEGRYSIPFFFNAHADYLMTCVPTCRDTSSNSNLEQKYPAVSYNTSQAIAQGE